MSIFLMCFLTGFLIVGVVAVICFIATLIEKIVCKITGKNYYDKDYDDDDL